MVNTIYSLIGGSGSTYSTIQEWELATRKDLVSADEAHVGIITSTGQWTYPNEYIYIGNSGSSATDSLRFRQLKALDQYFYDHSSQSGILIGTTTGSVSGGENYFVFGPGIGVQYGGNGYAIDLSGDNISVIGVTCELSGNNNGIRITNGNTGVISNSLIYGSYSGIGIFGASGIYSLNNTVFNRFPGTGIYDCYSVNSVSLSDNASYVPFVSGTQYYCAITPSSGFITTSETNLTGILQIHQFASTISGIEDFSIRSVNYSDIYSAGLSLDKNYINENGEYGEPYSALTGAFISNSLNFLVSDNTGNQRPEINTEISWSMGAFEKNSLSPTGVNSEINTDRFHWYLSSINYDDFSEYHGGTIGGEYLYEGAIDFIPEIINPINQWKEITGWSTNLPRIGITGATGDYSVAKFYRKDTLEEIKLRGWNLFQTSGDNTLTGFYYSDFSNFNSGVMDSVLETISSNKFNCVRVFIDKGSPTGRENSVVFNLTGIGLSSGYMDNFSTFVNMCTEKSLYVIPTLWDIPYGTYYESTLWSPSYDPSVVQSGNSRMDPGYLNTKKAYVTGFMSELQNRIGTGRMSTILAWTVDDDFRWRTDQAPYLTGYVTAGTAISGLIADNPNNSSGVWYMDSVSDRNQMAQLNIRAFYSGIYHAMTGIDSEALITASFSIPPSLTGYYDLTPQATYDSFNLRFHVPHLYDLSGSYLSFISLNLDPYDIYNNTSPSGVLGRLGITGADRRNQPLVLSEFGINSGVYSQLTGNSLTELKNEAIDLDGYGFKGYFLYSYYGSQPTGLGSQYYPYSALSNLFSPDYSPNIPFESGNNLAVYRKLFVKSINSDSLYNPRVYIEDPKYISQISIAKELESGDFTYSSYSIPKDYSINNFNNPFNYTGGLQYNTLNSGENLGVWTRINLNGPISDPQASFKIVLAGTSRQ